MKLSFNEEQTALIKRLGVSFDVSTDLNDDQLCELEDAVAEHLQLYGFDEQYNPTDVGLMCESIIDITSAA